MVQTFKTENKTQLGYNFEGKLIHAKFFEMSDFHL